MERLEDLAVHVFELECLVREIMVDGFQEGVESGDDVREAGVCGHTLDIRTRVLSGQFIQWILGTHLIRSRSSFSFCIAPSSSSKSGPPLKPTANMDVSERKSRLGRTRTIPRDARRKTWMEEQVM